MNIFVIPSWFPSSDAPTCGQFSLDQVEGIGEMYPSFNFCISTWGQQEESNLIRAKEPAKNFKKILRFRQKQSFQRNISSNIYEMYTPALTWTRKIFSGNIRNITKANFYNFELFQKYHSRIDVIHAHVAFPAGYVAMHLSEKFNIPFIITEHLDPFPTKIFTNRSGGLSSYIENPLKNASMVIVENKKLFNNIASFGIEKITCIPNMVNQNIFIPAKNPAKNKHFTFLYVGDMIDRKGITYLLKSISLLNTSSIKFRFCGIGEKLKEYKSFSELLKIDHTITWRAYLTRSEIITEFQKCDAFILPSLSENLGMVLLEAIACGKPVIATKCGGPEAIVNNNNGLLAEVGDSEDLAKKIHWMIRNYHTYDPKIIREDFLDRFSRPVVSAQIVELYRQIVYS